MSILIKILENDSKIIRNVQNFLFCQIKREFGYGYVPKFHEDIKNLEKFYILPERNIFLFAFDEDSNRIIATIGLRAYDKDFKEFSEIYSKYSTASVWRLFVDEEYRRCGIASRLFDIIEEFAYVNQYSNIYLHTHKTLDGAIDFWKKMGFKITIDTNNELQTVHMDKTILKEIFSCQLCNGVSQSGYIMSI